MEPATPVLGEAVELRCGVGELSSNQWESSVVSSGSKLTWSEGGVTDWSVYAGRTVTNTLEGHTIFRIFNFTVEDYGVYKCQCINDFTYAQYESCGGQSGLPTHCSASKEIYILPSGKSLVAQSGCSFLFSSYHIDQFKNIHSEFVNTPGETLSLEMCTSGWIRIDSTGSREAHAGTDVNVSSPLD